MKVLNVAIPESIYWHIRRCATDSRMSVKEFMAKFCKTAKPFNWISSSDSAYSEEKDTPEMDHSHDSI